MNEIIYQGLRLVSPVKYYKVIEGNTISLVEDRNLSTLTLTYTPDSTSWSVAEFLGIEKVGKDQKLEPTNRGVRFSKTYVSLNGLKLEKLTSSTHTINIVIVSDSESRVIQDYNHTTIVVSDKDAKDQDFINFVFYSGNLMYLRPSGPRPKCWEIHNFPKIIVKDKDLNLESTSNTVYQLRRRYDDYVIRAIDYQNQFILELRRILNDYGVELVRFNKEETLKKTSYIVYQFNQTPSKYSHPKYPDDDDHLMSHHIPIDFTLRTPDMVLFFDFKNKFNNVDLLTNFTEFKTTDKYGERWTAAIKWGQITEDFNHVYQQDDNSNFSYQCQFRCELYFYEFQDGRYRFLEEILQEIEVSG